MGKGLGSTFSITQQVHHHFSKQIHYSNCFVSSLAQLPICAYAILLTVLLRGYTYTCTISHVISHTIYYAIYKHQEL